MREQEQQEQEQPEQLAVLPSVLRALASAAFSRPGGEEGPDVHDLASGSYEEGPSWAEVSTLIGDTLVPDPLSF